MTQPPSYFQHVVFSTALAHNPPKMRGRVQDGTRYCWRFHNGGSAEAELTLSGGTTEASPNTFNIPSSSSFANPVTVAAGKSVYVAAVYDASSSRWDVVACVNGY